MFLREWLQDTQVAVYVLAYISAGKKPDLSRIIDDPELTRHRVLKNAIDTGDLQCCGELGPYLPRPNKAHGGSLVRFDDLDDYAKSVSFGWLDDLLRLWVAVRNGTPQEELEEIFVSFQTAPQTTPARRRGRHPKYDWTAFHVEIARRVGTDPDGIPAIQADLEDQMTGWCVTTWGEDMCPAESTIRTQVSKHYGDDTKGR